MKNSINQRIITALLSIAISILILYPVLSTGTIQFAGAASTPITVTINNIQDYVNELATITGTTSDTTPGTISKVQVQITNQSNNTYWDGSTWKAQLNIQTVDSAGIVGEYTSLAFNSSGNPAISYFDNTNKDLKFARWNGSSWVLQTVDSAGDAGQYTSLAYDSNGNPAISYWDNTNDNLKFAGLNGSWNEAAGKATWSYNMPSLTDGNSYKIVARAIDNSGKLLASATEYFTLYSMAPTVTLSSAAISPTRITPIPMTATFSRAVTGFVAGDITVVNGTADNFVAISAAIYTFDVTPTTQGVVTVNVAAGVAHDAVLNNNIAATQFSITYDTTVPPVNQDQSEYMIGSVTVAVIFPESNGSMDPNTENWSKSRMDTCLNEITAGLNWWKSLEPEAHLNFTIQNYYDKPTSYEPINRPSTDENIWINEILTGMGYTSGSYTQKVEDFNNYIRNYYKTDWVFTIFVVDSLNDPDGKFTDERHAYAHYGGPFMVMTYDNNGWGINEMDATTAHETGHIFYATDEYNNEAEYSGYLNILDDDNANCIMETHNWNACTATRGQIGWKDSDSDGILDPVDTFPDTTLNSYSTNIASNAITITCTGTALDIPLANNNPSGPKNNVTINTIKTIQYRIDNGPWLNVSSTDDVFDMSTEAFSFTTTLLSTGTHTIEARAQNSVGNWETNYAQKTITINPVTIITSGLVPSIPVTIRYTEDGQLKTATTDGTWIGNPDINSTLTIDKIIEVSPTERYSATDTWWRVTGADTYIVNYYHQWKPVITVTIENLNIRPKVYFVDGKETRQSRSRITLDGQLEWSEWVDTDSILNIESSVKKSWNNEWSSEDKNSWTVNSAITATINYTRNYKTIYMASVGIIGAVILMGFGIFLILRQRSKQIKEK